MNTLLRKFYDAAPEGGAGGGLPPSLADIGGAGPTPPVPPTPPTPPTPPEPPADPVEGLNEDGTLQEGYIKDAEGKVVKDPNYKPAGDPPAGEETDDDPEVNENFFADVDKLRGETIEIQYPEGMDPQSPEGVYHREKFLEERAVDRFEAYLKSKDPRGYAYLLHRQEGGSDEDFFTKKTFSLPEYETFKANVDIQTAVYKSSLKQKGLDEDSVQALVDKAIKENKLFDRSDAAYKEAEQSYQAELQELERKSQESERLYQGNVAKLNQQLSSSITEGKGMNLIIPDADKTPFLDFVRQSVQYDKQAGTFLLVQPISQENLNRQLEALYLQYKNGDLKALIAREARTQNAKRLGTVVNKSKQGSSSSGEGGGGPKPTGFVPLGSL